MPLKNEKIKNILSIVLLLGFAGMFLAGMANGEADVVLQKAVNICLECIGIG